MDLKLQNKTAIVTGASEGVGKVIALSLANEGCNVIICSRDKAKLIKAANEIKKNCKNKESQVSFGVVDVTDAKSIDSFFSNLPKKFKLDILVNNAGGTRDRFAFFEDLNDEQWQDSFNFNLMSAVRFVRHSLPLLKKSASGRIINTGTPPARQPGASNPDYISMKAALINLNKYLSNSMAKHNITVNAVCPGSLTGSPWERSIKDRADRSGITVEEAEKIILKEFSAKVPLGRLATPEDIANLVTFLASPLAEYITGTCIAVDGGLTKSAF